MKSADDNNLLDIAFQTINSSWKLFFIIPAVGFLFGVSLIEWVFMEIFYIFTGANHE